jgi:SNF2 family DNA or RNA helicase
MKEHLTRLEKSRAVSSNIPVPAPDGLEYKPYQKAGIAYALQRKDTLIGDEPGLGKTIQSIGFANCIRPKNILIVGPASLAYNWKMEAEKWSTNKYTIFIPSSGTDPVPSDDGMLVILNYEKTVGKSPLADSLKRVWDLLIIDECHALKNPESKRSIAVLGPEGLLMRSRRSLFLSGTPMENYPKEIWPLAATLAPSKFGDWWAFAKRYCGLHQEARKHGDSEKKVWVATGNGNLSELQQRLRASFMVRRLKADVLKELPPKRRQLVILGDETVDWSQHPEFRRWKELYEKAYEARLAELEACKTREEYRSKSKKLEAFTGVAFTEMSAFRHKTALLKLPMCLKYIDNLLESGLDSLVIFGHHKDVLGKVAEHYSNQCTLVDGDLTDKEERHRRVIEFQEGKKRIFIGSLKAAGTGITLTRASTVVFLEIDWVPATLSQAEDRLCRIGQKKMVHVIHLVLNGTLDVNMSQKVIKKQDVLDKALDHLPEVERMKQAG